MEQKKAKKNRKRKRMSAWKVAGIFGVVLLAVLLLIAILLLGAYFVLNRSGEIAFAKKQEMTPKGMISDENVSDNDVAENEQLEAGTIRYNGKTYVYKKDILTFLCMGIDKKGEVKASRNLFKGGQADALFLAVLDGAEKKISVISINRDTMAEISVYDKNGLYAGTEVTQIALAHAYGDGLAKSCENTVDAVSRLFYGLPIHGYCALNMSVIPIINDAVGGVDVVIPESLAGLGNSWTVGEQVHLMGEDAYTFIHNRDTAQAQSAEARLERQKQYLNTFVSKAKEAMSQDVTLPMKLYTKITPYMVTDISADEAVYLAGQAASYSFDQEDIYSLQGEVRMGEEFEEFYQDDKALYEMILDIFYEELP